MLNSVFCRNSTSPLATSDYY